MRLTWVAVASAWLLWAPPAGAEEAAGERVRVRLSDGSIVEATVVSRQLHTLEVELGLGFPVRIDRDQVVRDISIERDGRILHRLVGVDGRTDFGFVRVQDGQRVVLELYQGGELEVPLEEVRELVELRAPPDEQELAVALRTGRGAPRDAATEVVEARPEPVPPVPELAPEPPAPPPEPVVAKKEPSRPPPVVAPPKPKDNEIAVRAQAVKRPEAKRPPPEPIGPDPNRSRYLYGPSGLMLKEGEGSFSQKEVLFSTLAYGVSDHLTIEAGALTPAFLAGANGIHAMLGLRAGVPLGRKLILHGGAQTLFFPANFQSTIGAVYGALTYGDVDGHVTFTLAKPFWFNPYPFADVAASISGAKRMTNNLAFVTENWFIASSFSGPQFFDAVAIRILWNKSVTLDVGAVIYNFGLSPMGLLPIPWLDLSVRFGP